MSDFKFDVGFGRYNLHYSGSDKELVIPAELIATAGESVSISISATNANDITSITFPNNVTDVWFGTFYEKELSAIHVASDSPFLKEIDGVLFSSDLKTLIKAPCKMQCEYIVPQGVETLFNYSFRNSELECVVLPDSITTIENAAFQGCKKLENISIPTNVKEMDFNTFEECTELHTFEFRGNTVLQYNRSGLDIIKFFEEQISAERYLYYSEAYLIACLKQFPKLDKNLQRFIAAAVRGNRKEILTFLNGLKSTAPKETGEFRVQELSDTEVEIKKYIGEEETIEIPSLIDGKKVVSIGVNALKGNDYVRYVVIPEGIIKIGRSAFANCVSLEEVILPESCQTIENSAFYGCKLLKQINLPNGLTVLSENVFLDCVSLETLALPTMLKHIEKAALKNCVKLGSLTLPDGLLSLGKESLHGCLFDHGPKLETTWGYTLAEFTIPASVTKIDSGDVFGRYPAAEDKFGVFEYKVKLRVVKGSAAHKFAVKNRIKFMLVTE